MTKEEQLVYDCIKEYDDGRGLPAISYFYNYMGDQLTKGLECTIDQKEFVKIVEDLYEQGHLDKGTSFAGDAIYMIKKNPTPAQGNFFAAILDKFSDADDEQIMSTAETALMDFVEASQMTTPQHMFQAMILAANVGLGGTHSLTAKQKQLTDFIFSKIYTGEMDPVYNMLATDISESNYQMLELFCNVGKHTVGMPLLYYILSFAYIDGSLNPEVAERLEQIFGMVLLAQFFSQSDEE